MVLLLFCHGCCSWVCNFCICHCGRRCRYMFMVYGLCCGYIHMVSGAIANGAVLVVAMNAVATVTAAFRCCEDDTVAIGGMAPAALAADALTETL